MPDIVIGSRVQWCRKIVTTVKAEHVRHMSHFSTCNSWLTIDVRFPSLCYEYHWLIKELLWAYSRAIKEQSLEGETKQNAGRKEVDSERIYVALLETYARTLLVGHEFCGKI